MENSFQDELIISISDILDLFKNFSDKKKAKDIKQNIKLKYQTQLFCEPESIDKQIDKILREDKQRGEESELTYKNGLYSKRKRKTPPKDIPFQATEFTGKAGENAVMSELLFRYYNVNRMMVDDGVDIIAVKDNIYYYLQVKTVGIKDGKIYAQISNDNFDKYMGKQMRYFIVARTIDNSGLPKNIFFKFSQEDIDKGIFGRYIKRGEGSVSIKIKFDDKTSNPILYDEKEMDALWHMNNFDL